MDPKTLQQAFKFYDTFGDLNLEEFKTEIEKQSLPGELRELLIDLKKTEGDASSYFDDLEGSVAGFIEPPIPDKLGAWTLKELLDTGGMSSVYLAERDDEQYRMKAAAKFIHFSGYNPVVVQRFRQEMQFLALLDHPNITRIIDSGVTEHGVPWYIMEYVEGMPITRYCEENRLNLEQRLRLFVQVCHAVQHAHKNLVIHRDLKPSNIFVTSEGDVKLLDFGIAKAFSPDSAEPSGTMLTRENQALMTPEYASPEQLEGSTVSTASDVYSLGVILHELITGTRPYNFEEISRVKMVNRINERPPERPSATFRKRDSKPAGINQGKLSRELDDILLAALRAEPDRRYASAEQLGRDVSNFLNNETVLARADSRGYRFRKFVQRNRIAVALGGLSILILIGAVAAVMWQAQQTRLEAERAVAVTDFIVQLFETSDPEISGRPDITVSEVLDQSSIRIEHELSGQPEIQAEILGVVGMVYRSIARFDDSKEMLESSLQKRIDLYGDEHPLVASGLNEIGKLNYFMADYSAADSLYSRALDMRIRLLGNNHPETALSKRNKAMALTNLGRFDEAKTLHYDALDFQIQFYGEKNRDVADGRHQLGYTYHRAGQYNEAEHYYLQGLETNELLFGDDYHHNAGILNDLGMLYFHKADYQRGEEFHRRALQIRQHLFGEIHPDVSMSRNNIGLALRYQNRYDEAEEMFKKAIDIRRKIFGTEDIGLAYTKNNLAAIYANRGNFDEAERLNLESLRIRRVVFGNHHPSIALMLNNIGRLKRISGQVNESFPYFHEALEIYEQTIGLQHPNALITKLNMAFSHREAENFDTSLNYFTDVKEGRIEIFGENHLYVADVYYEMGDLYNRNNYFEDARDQFEMAATLYESTYPDGRSNLITSRKNLSQFYATHQQDPSAAENQLIKLYTFISEQKGADSDIEVAITELIDFYRELGDTEQKNQFKELLEELHFNM